jgi:hypothetical protein
MATQKMMKEGYLLSLRSLRKLSGGGGVPGGLPSAQ